MIGLSIHYVRLTHVDTCRPFIPIATYCSIAQIYYPLFTRLMDNFPVVLMLFSLNNHKEERWGKRSHSPCRMDKLLSARLDSNKERPLKCGSAWGSGAKTAECVLLLEQEAAACSARRREKKRQDPCLLPHTHPLCTLSGMFLTPALWVFLPPCLLWIQAPPSAALLKAWCLAHSRCSVK